MIAVVELLKKDDSQAARPCVIKWVGRKGLKIKILTYCGVVEAAHGVTQVPDDTPICEKCKTALKAKAKA